MITQCRKILLFSNWAQIEHVFLSRMKNVHLLKEVTKFFTMAYEEPSLDYFLKIFPLAMDKHFGMKICSNTSNKS